MKQYRIVDGKFAPATLAKFDQYQMEFRDIWHSQTTAQQSEVLSFIDKVVRKLEHDIDDAEVAAAHQRGAVVIGELASMFTKRKSYLLWVVMHMAVYGINDVGLRDRDDCASEVDGGEQ